MVKKLDFLNGEYFEVSDDTCRGCFLNKVESKELELYLDPVYVDEYISIRQDAECALPGFYIVSLNQHIGSLMDIEDVILCKLWIAIKMVRIWLEDLFGVKKVQIYQEERLENSHYHVWILPIWSDYISKYGKTPKIYDRDVVDYMRSYKFQDNYQEILNCNKKMKEYLQSIKLDEKLNTIHF